jgi:hypothetical protein
MKKSILNVIASIAGVILINSTVVSAQTINSTTTTPTPPLETILSEAYKQTENYRQTFRDLLAEETKIFEEYDKNGNSERRTAVKSNFLVYQSGKDASRTAELRNVFEVNGKIVPDGQRRAEQFLAELEKSATLEKELQKLQNEGSRYDKTWEIYGLTLNEAVTLAPNMRPFFEYQLMGTENFQDGEVYVVGYRQTKNSPFTVVNGKAAKNGDRSATAVSFSLDVPGGLKKNDKFLRGKLWIDAKTFQLRREERELTVQTPEPVVLLSTLFEYQPSEFGIMVPKTITVTSFDLKREKGGGGEKYLAVKDSTVNFEYSRFRKANVEVRVLDDDTP